jgi:hypothetical protein
LTLKTVGILHPIGQARGKYNLLATEKLSVRPGCGIGIGHVVGDHLHPPAFRRQTSCTDAYGRYKRKI